MNIPYLGLLLIPFFAFGMNQNGQNEKKGEQNDIITKITHEHQNGFGVPLRPITAATLVSPFWGEISLLSKAELNKDLAMVLNRPLQEQRWEKKKIAIAALVLAGADPDTQKNTAPNPQDYPLAIACQHADEELTYFLLESRANPNITCFSVPLEIAANRKDAVIAGLLLLYEADIAQCAHLSTQQKTWCQFVLKQTKAFLRADTRQSVVDVLKENWESYRMGYAILANKQ